MHILTMSLQLDSASRQADISGMQSLCKDLGGQTTYGASKATPGQICRVFDQHLTVPLRGSCGMPILLILPGIGVAG